MGCTTLRCCWAKQNWEGRSLWQLWLLMLLLSTIWDLLDNRMLFCSTPHTMLHRWIMQYLMLLYQFRTLSNTDSHTHKLLLQSHTNICKRGKTLTNSLTLLSLSDMLKTYFLSNIIIMRFYKHLKGIKI